MSEMWGHVSQHYFPHQLIYISCIAFLLERSVTCSVLYVCGNSHCIYQFNYLPTLW